MSAAPEHFYVRVQVRRKNLFFLSTNAAHEWRSHTGASEVFLSLILPQNKKIRREILGVSCFQRAINKLVNCLRLEFEVRSGSLETSLKVAAICPKGIYLILQPEKSCSFSSS